VAGVGEVQISASLVLQQQLLRIENAPYREAK
jgi:hypothetical protein